MKYIALVALLFLANTSFAASFNYTCTDFSDQFFAGSGNCTGNTVTNDGSYFQVGDAINSGTPNFPLNDGDTYYVSFTLTGGGSVRYTGQGGGVAGTYHNVGAPATISEQSFTVDSGVTPSGLGFDLDLNGTLTDICIDDDGISCSGSTPPEPIPFVPSFNTSTSTCTTDGTTTTCVNETSTQTVDNPVLDLFLGYILFFMTFGGVVWFFRKK